MEPAPFEARAAKRGFAVVALAVVAMVLAATPALERVDLALLDFQWRLLRRFDVRPVADDIVIVTLDEATVRALKEPLGLWHEPLGKAIARIAAAKPRAVGLDIVLPERSHEDIRPGFDRALALGLAAARVNGPLVANLAIDPKTRSARLIHAPFLAVLQEERLGLGMLARDIDGVTRRFSIAIPTEDGAFPTFAGRLCRAVSRRCSDGLLDFALGEPFQGISLLKVLEAQDPAWLESAFRGKIVLLGETVSASGRIPVPVDPAGWEPPAPDTPSVAIHALALRAAMHGAPQDASRPLAMLLASLPALLLLVRGVAPVMVLGGLGGVLLLGGGLVALRNGTALPLASPLACLALVLAITAAVALARRYTIRRR